MRLLKLRDYGEEIKHRRLNKPDPVTRDRVLNLEDPYVKDILDRIGRKPSDYRVAKRVAKLKEEYPNGTLPELIAIDWLNQKNIQYYYLVQIYGGHARRGGVEIDLLVKHGGRGLAWMIMGEYWHHKPEVAASDIIDQKKIIGTLEHGIRVNKVVALWEKDIYEKRPRVFEYALMGIGLRDPVVI